MKTILITGASRGLGRAMVEGFIARGHTVLACARTPQTVRQLADRHPTPHDFAAVNVASNGEVSDWARRLLLSHRAPDLLVNNAGVINGNAPLWKVSDAEFSRVMDINIKGTANVIRHFLPAMIQKGRGVIVNFSSGWGRSTSPEVAPYCASKWAIEGLTQALAQELPSGMAAIPLNPGIINTEMLQSCFGANAQAYPTAKDWAATAVPFLLQLGPQHNGQPLSL
jgi:NAD(P)-dependent dehydrogenase (short-subunit alcohol dehydrogenase family)